MSITMERPRQRAWPKCKCGKVASSTEDEAREKIRYLHAKSGKKQHVRHYYKCPHGSWHWTRKAPRCRRDNEIIGCACGGDDYPDQSSAHKAANAADDENGTATVDARAYICPLRGHHWSWYPFGKKLRHCACETLSYPTREDALLIAEHEQRLDSSAELDAYQCGFESWHLEGKEPA